MNDLTRVDRAVLQLRAQLQRVAQQRARRTHSVASSERKPLERLREANPRGSLADEDFRRKFVRALLMEELGDGLGNQPEFERISNEVWRILDEDADTRSMMDAALGQLGGESA